MRNCDDYRKIKIVWKIPSSLKRTQFLVNLFLAFISKHNFICWFYAPMKWVCCQNMLPIYNFVVRKFIKVKGTNLHCFVFCFTYDPNISNKYFYWYTIARETGPSNKKDLLKVIKNSFNIIHGRKKNRESYSNESNLMKIIWNTCCAFIYSLKSFQAFTLTW